MRYYVTDFGDIPVRKRKHVERELKKVRKTSDQLSKEKVLLKVNYRYIIMIFLLKLCETC